MGRITITMFMNNGTNCDKVVEDGVIESLWLEPFGDGIIQKGDAQHYHRCFPFNNRRSAILNQQVN